MSQRSLVLLVRIVARLPHGHAARALLFKIAGQPHGIYTAEHVFGLLSLARGIA